jgi:F-type H+-transporting ATPase subunit gamma
VSHLIQIRQRIKAIETIKKITHAMRLISMAAHAQLKSHNSATGFYVQSLRDLLFEIQGFIKKTDDDTVTTNHRSQKKLIVIIGSQKGLCGTFNTHLLQHIQYVLQKEDLAHTSFLIVGGRIIDPIMRNYNLDIIDTVPLFSLKNVAYITKKIQKLIPQFSSVTCISNRMISFFVQEPQTFLLNPEQNSSTPTQTADQRDEYLWEITPEEILTTLIPQYYEASITHILLQSLLAEHAARFIAMDNATRNARTLLDEKKLEYNKLRQSLITKELTELSGIFST